MSTIVSPLRVVSCVVVMYVTAVGTFAAPARLQAANPDELFAAREDIARAEAAERIWAAVSPATFDSSWKLARVDYWIGGHAADESRRRTALDAGVAAGTQAIQLNARRPEGYFWRAANMGALAESFGITQGLKYRGRIKSDLETVLGMDPAWQEGSADRALGRWYDKVPGLFGGSDAKAEAHYRASLAYNPRSTASLCFLAELLIDHKRRAEANVLLQRILDAPIDPDWAPEDREFKAKARTLLSR
jgi:hypothetical protein